LEAIRRISELADIHFVWQKELRGLGDAVYCARHHIKDEPFVVLLGDTLIDSGKPAARQLQEVFEKYQAPVVLLEKVSRDKVSRYGIVDAKQLNTRICQVKDIIEKPSPEQAPSDLAIAGRYVLTPDIFDYLSRTRPGRGGEIQLTDAMRMMLKDRSMYGLYLDGKRCDIGNKEGFIKTNIEFALKRDDVADTLKEYIKKLAENI
jgi:UTP--glucose-1-phosphate uridylyltransferase